MDTKAVPSVYDIHAPELAKRDFYPLVIGPGQKKPQHYVPCEDKYYDTTGWAHPRRPYDTGRQPGAGIGVRCGPQGNGTWLVSLDWDSDDAALAALESFPATVAKEGQRGFTSFYRSTKPIPARDFRINGAVAVQILSEGRQTVLPPTIHPDTLKPYTWMSEFTLFNTPLDSLPEFPENYLELIEGILRPMGYVPEPEKVKPEVNGNGYDAGDNPFWELNGKAIRNLIAWVPDLGLCRLRRRSGRTASYEAVPNWRPSVNGDIPDEQRNLNLRISGLGITDFGNGEKFSPIDLVMRARNCERSEAVAWLMERVEGNSGPEIDFEKIISDAPGVQPGPETEGPQPEQPRGQDEHGRPVPPSSLGRAWHFGEPVPAQLPMLVPHFLPQKGFGYLGGQWGTFKTFVTNDLAVAIGSGGKFAGQQVAYRGAVVQIELEGSHTELRLYAAAAKRGANGHELPIVHLRVSPPKIMLNAKPNPAWAQWSRELAKYAKEFAAYHDLPLALITIDPQNSVAGFRDEQSSAEGQIVSDAWFKLSEQAGCSILIVDHLGKDPEAGLRGTSAKETNPLFILSTGATQKDVFSKRQFEVRKMRNGQSGLAVSFWMEEHEVTVEQIVETTDGAEGVTPYTDKTLVMRWADELRPVGMPEGGGDEVSKQQRRALAVLGEMIAKVGESLPPECEAPGGLLGVKLESWRLRLIDRTVIEGKNTGAAFSQLKNALLDRKEIDISHGLVWVPLP